MAKFDENIVDLLVNTNIVNNSYEKKLYKVLSKKKHSKKQELELALAYFIGKAIFNGLIPNNKIIFTYNESYYLMTQEDATFSRYDYQPLVGDYVLHYLSKMERQKSPKHLKFGESDFLMNETSFYKTLTFVLSGLVVTVLVISLGNYMYSSKIKVPNSTTTQQVVSIKDNTRLKEIDDLFENTKRDKIKDNVSFAQLSELEKKIETSNLSETDKNKEKNVLEEVKKYVLYKNDIKELNKDNPQAVYLISQSIEEIKSPSLYSDLQKRFNEVLMEDTLKTIIESRLYDSSLSKKELSDLKQLINSINTTGLREFKNQALAIIKEQESNQSNLGYTNYNEPIQEQYIEQSSNTGIFSSETIQNPSVSYAEQGVSEVIYQQPY